MSTLAFKSGSFDECYANLLTLSPPLLPPAKPTDVSLTDAISSLYIHPALEAALHILNCDLPSAHFLVRRMEAPPAYESMFLHGILHRIEGDFDNARAWYGDVSSSDVFKAIWSSKDEAMEFVDNIQTLVKQGRGSREELEKRSLAEIKGVVEVCVSKFGKEPVQDARPEWKFSEGKARELKQEMISGHKGYRKF